jgi:hypothetical protein
VKVGQTVRIINLDYFDSENDQKRSKKFIGMEGVIKDIYLGVNKIEIDGTVYNFDGRELELAEKISLVKADFVFVSWQKAGKSVYNTKEGDPLFVGDFHHGTSFKGEIELTSEEALRVTEAAAKGVTPVFDLRLIQDDKKSKK